MKDGGNKSTLFNAKDDLVEEGLLVVDDTRKPQVWHLVDDKGEEAGNGWT